MLIPYALPSYATRLDTWRAFESSWLFPNGRPTTEVCCLTLDHAPYALDSFALKQAFNAHHFKHYKTFEDWFDALLGNDRNVFRRDLARLPLKGWPQKPLLYKNLNTSHHVRFICPISCQPFMGQIFIESQDKIDTNALEWILLDKRSQAFLPWDLADTLFNQISQISEESIMSLHLARRGGISYQGLRACLSIPRSLEDWLCKSTME